MNLWVLSFKNLAFRDELAPHFIFRQNVNGVEQKVVTLSKIFYFDNQTAIQEADQVLEPFKVDLVGALRYLDDILGLVVVPRNLGHVS